MSVVQPYRFTVDDFVRMGEAGVFDEDARLELLDGQIVEMSPINPPHAGTVALLNRLFIRALGERILLWPQNPVVLSDFSMPQPDIVLVKPRPDSYRTTGHPRPEDILLLVEVADTSGPIDRRVKLPLYARAGVREYWIVDLRGRVIEVHRDPGPDGYAHVEKRSEGGLAAAAFPKAELDVREVLGPEPSS